jgi:non-canonical purine NTP pyrophosphatase (RdgB/HAM1 family)
MTIKFATGNKNKLQEARFILGVEIEQVTLELDEIQAVDVAEVISHKSKEAFQLAGEPVLVEDTALEFKALNGLPGALIKWFLEGIGNEGLVKIVDSFGERAATARTCVGLFDGTKLHVTEGSVSGRIAKTPKGENGFGWDKIFIPDGYTTTFAEMDADTKNSLSMRKIAFEKMKAKLPPET